MSNQSGMLSEYYSSLLEYAKSDKEVKLLEACVKYGSPAKAAPHVNIGERSIRRCIGLVKERRAIPREMIGNLDTPVKSPMAVKGTSTLYDAETGEAKITWVKTDKDKEQALRDMLGAVEDAVSSYKPLKRVKSPKKSDKDTMTIYPMGDPHIGMYAWAGETGEDFDCDIAEKNLRHAMQYLVDKAPPSETAIILNLGDFFHGDNSSNTTTRGTAVDIDSRWGRVYEIGMTLMIDCVNMALEKHKKVLVRNNVGNHDRHTSQALSVAMKHIFKSNPRVEIADASNPFFIHEFGNNLIFSTHGDGLKPKQAQGFIANAYSELWGRTEHRLALFGHFHHEDRKEENGLIVEIFNTLAASDAWHHASGYRSKRNMKCLVLDREEGEIERYTFSLKRKSLVG